LDFEDFNTWFSRTSLKILRKDLVVLEVPNKFFEKWFREKYLHELSSSFEKALKSKPTIRFETKKGTRSSNESEKYEPLPETVRPSLDPILTFDNFVCADSNAFAYYSSIEIINETSSKYNPLFIFSDKSVGKTHLLNAIGNRAILSNKDCSAEYVHADQFTKNLSLAMRSGMIHEFRDIYTSLDLLLFDDVHLLEGRKKSQEEFTFLLDSILRSGKTVVISGKKVPFRLEDTNPRLRSILGWGLLAEIYTPEQETRIKILKEKTAREDFPLPEDIIFFLAKSNDDMKELFRNMTRLQTFASLNGGSLSLSAVKTLIRDRKETDIQDIQSIAAGYFRVSIPDLKSDKRKRAFAYPRQVAMYLCRKFTGHSYKKIGMAFGNKDHSTVIHAFRRIDKELSSSHQVQEDIKNLENLIS
jgi:chromosomal replication initiator protein